MELRKINGFTFVNETEGTRNGFRHISHLFNDFSGAEIASGKVNYLNRTWESYRYQTSMREAANNAYKERADYLMYLFKERKGISRITKKYEDEWTKELNGDETLKSYIKLLAEI